jgi:hypothetical protein
VDVIVFMGEDLEVGSLPRNDLRDELVADSVLYLKEDIHDWRRPGPAFQAQGRLETLLLSTQLDRPQWPEILVLGLQWLSTEPDFRLSSGKDRLGIRKCIWSKRLYKDQELVYLAENRYSIMSLTPITPLSQDEKCPAKEAG